MTENGFIALVRPPSAALARCELSYVPRTPIDVERAVLQHQAYVSCLESLGARVVALPPEPELPDAAFVEDAAVVLDEVIVIARPGAESRRPEVPSVAAALARFGFHVAIAAPGTLDGGDVLRIHRTLFVGQSRRTNAAGIAQLGELAAPYGYEVRPVAVRNCLHLKSACSYAGGDTVLISRAHVDPEPFQGIHLLDVPALEPFGANTTLMGDVIVMAAGFPDTAELLRRGGREVRAVEVSEFRKAEGGVSCLSVPIGGSRQRNSFSAAS